jgi:hypothetical protein
MINISFRFLFLQGAKMSVLPPEIKKYEPKGRNYAPTTFLGKKGDCALQTAVGFRNEYFC